VCNECEDGFVCTLGDDGDFSCQPVIPPQACPTFRDQCGDSSGCSCELAAENDTVCVGNTHCVSCSDSGDCGTGERCIISLVCSGGGPVCWSGCPVG
jgi:hypothetical protein